MNGLNGKVRKNNKSKTEAEINIDFPNETWYQCVRVKKLDFNCSSIAQLLPRSDPQDIEILFIRIFRFVFASHLQAAVQSRTYHLESLVGT